MLGAIPAAQQGNTKTERPKKMGILKETHFMVTPEGSNDMCFFL